MLGNRYDLTDFEWSVIEPVLPRGGRGAPRKDKRRIHNGTAFSGCCLGCPVARLAGVLRPLHHGLQPLQLLAEGGCMGPHHGRNRGGLRRRGEDDRHLLGAGPPTCGQHKKVGTTVV